MIIRVGKIWLSSLKEAFKGIRSSLNPIMKIRTNAPSKYLKSKKASRGNHNKRHKTNPIKRGTPPREGVELLWIFLPPGESRIFHFSRILIKTGNRKMEKTNDVKKYLTCKN